MYNRYIGNTGKFYRVEEQLERPKKIIELHAHQKNTERSHTRTNPQKSTKPTLFGGGGKFLDFDLPFGLDISDLVILCLFFFLYLESKDEEFLIILGFLAYSIFKEHKGGEPGLSLFGGLFG